MPKKELVVQKEQESGKLVSFRAIPFLKPGVCWAFSIMTTVSVLFVENFRKPTVVSIRRV